VVTSRSEPVCKGPALDGRLLRGCANIQPMLPGCTATGVERLCERDRHVQQRGRAGGWSTSDPQSQHRKPNVGDPGRPSAATMDAPLLICQRLRVSRQCKRPATPVGRLPTPCSWIWRWSTKSLGLRSISPEGPRCRMGQTSVYSVDVHVRPRLGDGERSTRLMACTSHAPTRGSRLRAIGFLSPHGWRDALSSFNAPFFRSIVSISSGFFHRLSR
jgi:hypothetical protein